MVTITISLPDDVKVALDARATAGGFATTEAYIADLLRMEAEDVD